MKNITVEQILESPFSYENMLVHVIYKTYWKNKGNQIRQEKVYFTGRISFISTSVIQIANDASVSTIPIGYFVSIVQAMPDIDYSKIAYENFELKHKISELKKLLEK